MDISAIPTDSLYKFLAVSGIFILASAVFFAERRIREARKSIYRLRYSLAKYAAKNKELTNLYVVFASSKTNASREAALQNISQSDFLDGVMKVQLHELKDDIQYLREARTVMAVGVTIGFFIAVLGFYLWYVKLQQPLDSALQNQLSECSVESNK